MARLLFTTHSIAAAISIRAPEAVHLHLGNILCLINLFGRVCCCGAGSTLDLRCFW